MSVFVLAGVLALLSLAVLTNENAARVAVRLYFLPSEVAFALTMKVRNAWMQLGFWCIALRVWYHATKVLAGKVVRSFPRIGSREWRMHQENLYDWGCYYTNHWRNGLPPQCPEWFYHPPWAALYNWAEEMRGRPRANWHQLYRDNIVPSDRRGRPS